MTVLCLGDSLTEGTVGVGFIPFLEEFLPQHRYVNLGVNGDTIAGLRQRAEQLQQRGDAAVVWIGTNDVLLYPTWDDHAVSAAADYERILRLASERTGKVLAVPPLLADPALAHEYQRSYFGATGLVRRQSGQAGASYVDIQTAFGRFPGTGFTIDGAHLNNAGARLVAEVLSEHLRVVLA